MEIKPDEEEGDDKQVRGKGRGSRFFAVDRDVWVKLWKAETTNRFNLIAAYLVLSAGTGSDHRLTKWSAKAIEEYVGIGKPRGQRSIQELVDAGLIKHSDRSTRMTPQYVLPELGREVDPIFLPIQLITGLGTEAPILRRIREIGDPYVLCMLVDLYGLLQIDSTFGLPLDLLRMNAASPAKKLVDVGANALWAFDLGRTQQAGGEWPRIHQTKDSKPWALFWERVGLLEKIGALYFEPWIFDGDGLDAEPLFPVDERGLYETQRTGPATHLTKLAYEAAVMLLGDRTYYIERAVGSVVVPLPAHYGSPEIRGVAKLRVEADTPGRRLAYAQRMNRIESYGRAFSNLCSDAFAGRYDRPLRLTSPDGRT